MSSHSFDPTLQKRRHQSGSPGRGPPLAPQKQTGAAPAPILATPAASPRQSRLPVGGHTWPSAVTGWSCLMPQPLTDQTSAFRPPPLLLSAPSLNALRPPSLLPPNSTSSTMTFLCPGSASLHHLLLCQVRHPSSFSDPSFPRPSAKAVRPNTQLYSQFLRPLGRPPFSPPS